MSDNQLSEREIALILDLARLLKKHGSATFKSLADSLADPAWSARLSEILSAVAATAPEQQPMGQSRKSRSTSERIAAQLNRADPSRSALLSPRADKLVSGEALPSLKDVAEFASIVGLPVPRTKSRGDAVVALVRAMIEMPINELEKVVREIDVSVGQDRRSLQGWNRIIERSRAETTDRQIC
jgi:hypothetical protein